MHYWLFKILVVPVFYLFSLIPFFLLYPFSSVLAFLLYNVVAYRKQVVLENLRKSFPEKSEQELRQIAKTFYVHFCDTILETIKLLTMSEQTFKKRCSFDKRALATFQHFFRTNQSVVGLMGHCGNWEWAAIAHQFYFREHITGVYHPLSSKSFDEFMFKLRTRKGGHIIPMSKVYPELLRLQASHTRTTLGLIADQAPPPESAVWTKFLNQDTAFYMGPEKIARRFNYPVIYLGVKKVKRGHYVLHVKVLSEHPAETQTGDITRLYVEELEKDIREQAFNWLWSHRRWKHKRPPTSKPVL
ncbi:MAG TPA: lysophospholipid acyltransferase family protein [Bacteroidia bacterium]|nr:lysophospholipid acyltransferase family protein [Bacteroidia bacterium]